jgi:hypothetical protein
MFQPDLLQLDTKHKDKNLIALRFFASVSFRKTCTMVLTTNRTIELSCNALIHPMKATIMMIIEATIST